MLNWKNFIRIALAVFLTGAGISVFGESGGSLIKMLIGLLLAGIGIALLVSE